MAFTYGFLIDVVLAQGHHPEIRCGIIDFTGIPANLFSEWNPEITYKILGQMIVDFCGAERRDHTVLLRLVTSPFANEDAPLLAQMASSASRFIR